MPGKKHQPMRDKEDIPDNPDQKIDQDFEGYPHGPARDKTLQPLTKEDDKVAGTDTKDGEKINIAPEDRESIDEQDSDGSANAFAEK